MTLQTQKKNISASNENKSVLDFLALVLSSSVSLFKSPIVACELHRITQLVASEISDSEISEMRDFYIHRVPDLPDFLKNLLMSPYFKTRILKPNFRSEFNLPGTDSWFSTSFTYKTSDQMILQSQLSFGTKEGSQVDRTSLEVNLWYAALASQRNGLPLSPQDNFGQRGLNIALLQLLSSMLYETYKRLQLEPELKSIFIQVLAIQNPSVEEMLKSRGFFRREKAGRPTYYLSLNLVPS